MKIPLSSLWKCVGVEIEVVIKYKYQGLNLDNKIDWSLNTDELYNMGQSYLFILSKRRTLAICNKMLQVFYQSVMASVLDTLGEVVERCTIKRLEAILNIGSSTLYHLHGTQKPISTGRLLCLCCKTERYRKSFAPTASRHFSSHTNSKWTMNFPLRSYSYCQKFFCFFVWSFTF